MSHPILRADDRILFGAAFYDEYRVTGSLESDLDLMADAGFSVIRVGESVWSTWEPEPGAFNLDWLAPVLDAAHDRGIDVILGTPTYAIPGWLSQRHPEIAAETSTGQREPWGGRQEVDIDHPTFRFYAERVIRAVVTRYAAHPAVVGFQVDNEPGLHLLHNWHVHLGFQDYLRRRYRTVEALNREWGLTYWSHRLRDFSELWTADGNHSPQYQLEWRRFQTQLVNEFIGWQAGIVRQIARADQFVTTCISYERRAVDDRSLAADLDVTAGNPYYKMQDALDIQCEVPREEMWWSSGVWGLYEQADRMWSTRQERFLVTETNAQSIGQSHWQNHTPYPGQIELSAMALVARGAGMIEYWQWQTLHHGIETYWGGVLPHSGRPGRIYQEIAALGSRLRQLGPRLTRYTPDADVTLLYSMDTKRSFEFYPPLADERGGPDRNSYLRIFDAFYRGAFEAGAQIRVLHTEQLMDLMQQDPQLAARQHPVLIVPTLYVASDSQLDALTAYSEAGGHLVIGIRTGYGDELARARPERAPARIGPATGIWYDEYTTLDRPVSVTSTELELDPDAQATGWADAVQLDGAETLVQYAEGMYAGLPVVTTRVVGQGRITYVATVPNRALASAIVRWAIPSPIAGAWTRDTTVTVTSGRTPAGRVWFVSNWSSEKAYVVMAEQAEDVASGEELEADSSIPLAPWSVRIWLAPSASAAPPFTTAKLLPR